MNKYHFVSIAFLAFTPSLFAQTANTAESTQIEATTGPVTVTTSQPATLANASDYKVRTSDLDTNGDGQLSRREIPATHALTYEFHLVDRNHNGFITDAELKKANWQ